MLNLVHTQILIYIFTPSKWQFSQQYVSKLFMTTSPPQNNPPTTNGCNWRKHILYWDAFICLSLLCSCLPAFRMGDVQQFSQSVLGLHLPWIVMSCYSLTVHVLALTLDARLAPLVEQSLQCQATLSTNRAIHWNNNNNWSFNRYTSPMCDITPHSKKNQLHWMWTNYINTCTCRVSPLGVF